ncbi:MAG: hypothetical protein NW200_03425 [Hyphomonadaceae bacterium]|nr:hypothetical protein [Hyphomonadaceae bacterium]
MTAPPLRWLAPGRAARGVAAWLAAALAAGVIAATLVVGFLLVREAALFAPFAPADWWVFLNLWRPLAVGGVILAPLFSAPVALAAVWLIRRRRWPRPQADILAGALAGMVALAAVLSAVRLLAPIGDGQ